MQLLAIIFTLAMAIVATYAVSGASDERSAGQAKTNEKCFFSLMNCALWRSDRIVSAPMSFSKGIPFALKKGLARYYNRKGVEKNMRYLMTRL